jgi:hypothetical protein
VVGLETVSIGVEVDERREVLRVLGFQGHVVFLHRRRIVVEGR